MRITDLRRWAMALVMGAMLGSAMNSQAVGTGNLSTNSGWYAAGSVLNVTATPGSNSVFDTWLGDTNSATITGGTNIEFTIDGPMSITGRFSHIIHSIAITAGAGGSMTPLGPVTVNQGNDQVFTISASNNYSIADVKVDGGSEGAIGSYTFTNVMASHTIDATFTINQYTISFNSDGGSAVSPITQNYNTAVTPPSAPTRTGYNFTGWNPAVPATIPGSNLTVTAQWSINQYTISFNSDGGSAVSPITQNYNTAVTPPSAPTRTGHNFTGWNPALPGTMPSSNLNATAQWSIKQYSVTYTAGANGSATGTLSQTIDHGSDATTVGAVASNGYHFVNWSDLSTSNPRTDSNVTNDITVTANFAINEYTFNMISDHGTVDSVGTTTNDYGTTVVGSITDSPVTNALTMYRCTGWTAAGSAPATGTGTNLSFTITNDTTVTWQWETNYWVDFQVIGN